MLMNTSARWIRVLHWVWVSLWILSASGLASAQAAPPPVPTDTTYTWWLSRWSDNQSMCGFTVFHAGSPSAAEVERYCGGVLRTEWESTPPCESNDTALCAGVYLHLAFTTQQPRAAAVPLRAESWMSGPLPADAPAWLRDAPNPEALASTRTLLLLAGQLIAAGQVNAADCESGGLLEGGAANPCGEARARAAVLAWQNQFDAAILEASHQTRVPPYLLKNIFAQEGQFWPGAAQSSVREYGLGHLSEMGADALLMWNESFYRTFCPTRLGAEACAVAYAFLPADQQALLRGSVLAAVQADCPMCAGGVDVEQAQRSVPYFAQTLVAYAEQTGQMISNVTGRAPASVANQEDLWRLTAAAYNAGAGCVGLALARTVELAEPVTWANVSTHLDAGCQGALAYVENVSRVEAPRFETPMPVETFTPTASPTSTAEPETPTPAPTATATPLPSPTTTPPPNDDYIQGELIVKFKPEVFGTARVEALTNLGATDVDEVMPLGVVLLKVDSDDWLNVLAALKADPSVEFVEPNYIAEAYLTPNDPDWNQQAHLNTLQLPAAWEVTTGSNTAIVAIVDTGLWTAHPDLAAQVWSNLGETGADIAGNDKRLNGVDDDHNGYVDDWQGWNTIARTSDVTDDNGHGTHVAGIIGAAGNNGVGLAGVTWGARLLPVKALDYQGFGTYLQVAEAIVYASNQGAHIINLSLGSSAPSATLQRAIDYAVARGALVIAASGDTGAAGVSYPAALPNVLAVGAVEATNARAAFSSFGAELDLVAPGADIYSASPSGYAVQSGTSMAAAHVAGVAALLVGQPSFETAALIRAALEQTALDLGASGPDAEYGYGLVQAYSALQYTGQPVETPTPTPSPTPDVTATPEGGGVEILAVNNLFAQTSMARTNCTATNETNAYTPLTFDGVVGSCQFTAAGAWTYNNVQNTTLTAVYSATLTLNFYTQGWVDDQIVIELSTNGTIWNTVATFAAGAVPPTTLTYFTYNAYPWITSPAAANGAQVRFRVVAVGTLDAGLRILSDQMRLSIGDVFIPQTPTAPAPAPTTVPNANDPHVDYNATTASCAACHRTHTAPGRALRVAAPEEAVCFTCHTAGGSGTNIQPAFTTLTNTATRLFKHDVAFTNNVHQVGQNTGASFGGANRHSECEDCHEPHEATRGTTSAPMIQRVMNAASGVDPLWAAAGAPSGYTWLLQADREYQVCLKCHSGFTMLPTYAPDGWNGTAYVANGLRKLTSANGTQVLDSRDLAREFNPYNASYHPVAAQGRNPSAPAGGFVAGWSATRMVYCSDCHTNAAPANGAVGPHGSPRLHILDGANNYSTVDNNTALAAGELCFKCHKASTYTANTDPATNSRFVDGNTNLHELHSGSGGERAPCYVCHDSHGSEQQHLLNFDTAVVTINAGYNSQTAWTWNGTTGTCYISCHGTGHGTGKQYTP